MNLDQFPTNLYCNCQDPYLRTKMACDIPLYSSQSFFLPLVLGRISSERMKTTYQYDFDQSNKHTSMIYDNSIIIDESKKSATEKLNNYIECRPAPKLPYLHGHNIPGRKRQKILLSQINDHENGQNMNVLCLDHRQKVNFFNDREIKKSALKPRTNIHNQSSTYIDATNSIIDSVTDDLYIDNYRKIIMNRRYSNGVSSIDKKTGDIKENFSSFPWISEYQDTISETAEKILKTQLHSHKRHKTIINQKAI